MQPTLNSCFNIFSFIISNNLDFINEEFYITVNDRAIWFTVSFNDIFKSDEPSELSGYPQLKTENFEAGTSVERQGVLV